MPSLSNLQVEEIQRAVSTHIAALQAATPGSPDHALATAKLLAAVQVSAALIPQTNGINPQTNGQTNGTTTLPTNGVNMPSVSLPTPSSGSIILPQPTPIPTLGTTTRVPNVPTFTTAPPAQPKGDDPVASPEPISKLDQRAKPSSIIPGGISTTSVPPRDGSLAITGLGAQLVSSSTNPVASVTPPRDPVLSTVQNAQTMSQITGVASALASQTISQVAKPLPVIKVNATAPRHQPHAQLWSKAINAAKSSSAVTVGGVAMSNVGLASIGADGTMVKMPLAQALNIPSGQAVQVDKAAAPAALAAASTAVAKAAAQPPTVPPATEKLTEPATVPVPAAVAAVAGAADPTEKTPSGFVLSGDIKLFGKFEAERFIYQGTAADGKAEMVTFVQQPVALDDVFQGSGVSFGSLMLNKASISYYDASSSTGREKGLWLDAGILLSQAAPDVATDATDLFGQDQANQLAVIVGLGGYTSWSAALKPPTDLTIKAFLPNASGKLGKHLEFTSASVTLVAAKPTTATTPGTKPTYSWDATFTGTVLFTAPSSIAPLHLDFEMKKNGTTYDLKLTMNKDEEWTTAMGISGMNLSNVVLSAIYDKAKKDSLAFGIVASVKTTTWSLDVNGSFQNDDFELNASLNGYTWQKLDDLFHKMFGSPLQETKHDITFSELALSASSKDRDLKLHGMMSADAWLKDLTCDIDISSKGFHLTAVIPEMHCNELTIKSANVTLFVGKRGDVDPKPDTPGTATYFQVDGLIDFKGIELAAAAYFDKDPQGQLMWALYAQLKPQDAAKPPHFSLSKLFGMGKRTDLDLALENFAVTASNSATLGDLMPQNFDYKVKEGTHLFAKVDCPNAVSKALNTKPASVTLQVDLAPTNKDVELVFNSPQHMNLKPGMASTEVAVGINFSQPEPKLFVKADINVQFSSQPTSSVFKFELEADMTEAEITGSMETDWVNPFNLSPKVKVLAPVELGAEIIYISPLYPNGLSFAGGLQVGAVTGKAAFKVTTSPKEGVLLVEVDNLGIKDIISFASLIIDHTIPQPRTDFLKLQQLKLGLSTGASLDDTYYPEGITYDAKMQLFGKTAEIKADINKDQMHLYGEIDAFTLGPLTIAGNTGKNPTVDLVVSEKSQKLQVDGNIRLWDVDAGITIVAGLEPLDLDFDTQLSFGELLDFKLHADVVGKVDNLKDLMKSDFTFSGTLEQHILDYIMAHANTYILAAKKGVDEDVGSAQAKLDAAQKSYTVYITKQQATLDAAKLKWDRQNQSVTAAADAKKAQIKAQTTAKQAAVDAAKAKLDALIQSLEKKLSDSKATAASEIATAQKKVNDEKARVDADVNGKVAKLQQAQASLAKSFGSADNALENARAKVQNAQNDLGGTQQRLNNAKSDLSHASFFNKIKYAAQVAEIGIELGAKEAALKVAQGILVAAEAVVNGVGYKLAREAVTIAQDALDDAKKVADAALNNVNKALSETQKVQAGLVDVAYKALADAQKGCDESKAWDAAKKLLADAISLEASVVADTEKIVAALASCAEKIAYDAACAALALAKAGTKEIDLANKGLELVKDCFDEVTAIGSWMIKNLGNVFNIRVVQLSGSLGEAAKKTPLKAHIEGEFCDAPVKFDVDFVPGKAEDMMKQAFDTIMKEVKGNIGAFIKKL